MLTITTPTTSQHLLTIEEMRDLAGVYGSVQDATLERLGKRIAADICAECNIAIGAGAPPTLLRETVSEIHRNVCVDRLLLARRHEIAITSITVDGSVLSPADYEVDPESGIVTRLAGDASSIWQGGKVIVVYAAGFEPNAIPDDLAHAAADFFRFAWREKDRDPAVRGERIATTDIEDRQITYWAGALPGASEGPVPDFVAGQLARFRNWGV